MTPTLATVSDAVCSARSVEELARPLLQMLEAVTGMETTYLTSIDEVQGVQRVLYARNSSALQIPEGLVVPWHDTLCKRALDQSRSYTSNVPALWGDSSAARDLGIHTYVSTPVRMADGALYGTLCAASTDERACSPDTQRTLVLFAHLIGQHVERELRIAQLLAANQKLAAVADTDQLTGLPNRRALMPALERMLAQGQRLHVNVQIAFVDLDCFKAINDTQGHDIGDQFLMAIAERLTRILRADDLAARMGGDEFVVISLGPEGDAAAAVARDGLRQRIAQATQGRFELSGATLDYAGASVGVVTIAPGASVTANDALRLADQHMYAVKHDRRRTAAAARS
jgi:diguanylate cyclase